MKKLCLVLLCCFPLIVSTASAQDCADKRDCVPETQEVEKEAPKLPSGGILAGKEKAPSVKEVRGHVANQLIPRFINFVLVASISASILLIIIGGIIFTFSLGESEKIGNAKKMIIYALVGLMISVFAYSIVRIVTGIKLIDASLPMHFVQDLSQPDSHLLS